MIKRFKSYIQEAHLTTTQRNGFVDYAARRNLPVELDTPSKKAQEISGKIMPDTIEVPMMNSTMQAIHDHLKSNGYSEVDYGNKVAHRDVINKMGLTQRITTNIGKALTQTKADKGLIDSFNNDNHKEAADLAKNYKVIISRVPRHIAACSTNTPWSSCARLDTWGNPSVANNNGFGDPKGREEPEKWELDQHAAGHLPQEIKQGSHVAYLVPNMTHPDNKIKYPHIADNPSHQDLIDHAQARILVKRHTSTRYGDDILIPESKVYSNMDNTPSGFFDSVKHFTDKHFTPENNVVYQKHTDLYNDDGNFTHFHLNLSKPIEGNYIIGDNLYKKQTHIKSDDITNFINTVKDNPDHSNYDMMNDLPKLPNFSSEHIDHYANNWDKFPDSVKAHITEKKLTKNQFNTIFEKVKSKLSDNEYYNNKMMFALEQSPHSSSSHIKDLLSASYTYSPSYAHQHLLTSHKLKGKDLANVIDLYKNKMNNSYIAKIKFNPNLEENHIDSLLSNKIHDSGLSEIPAMKNIPNINKILDNLHSGKYHPDNTQLIYNTLIEHPKFTLDHFEKMVSSDNFLNLPQYGQQRLHTRYLKDQ